MELVALWMVSDPVPWPLNTASEAALYKAASSDVRALRSAVRLDPLVQEDAMQWADIAEHAYWRYLLAQEELRLRGPAHNATFFFSLGAFIGPDS